MTIKNFMTRNVVTVGPGTLLKKAAIKTVGDCILVAKHDRLVGIADRDTPCVGWRQDITPLKQQ